jgi:hypothetical protein
MNALLGAAVLAGARLADTVKPPPDDKVSPGLLGFLVTFAVVLATVLLIRSMVGHLRKVRYSPDPSQGDQPGRPGREGQPDEPAGNGDAAR